MRPNVLRVRDAVLNICCGPPPHHGGGDPPGLRQSMDRWWNTVLVMCRLLGTRQYMSVLQEAGALWSQGELVVRPCPATKAAAITAEVEPRSSRSRPGLPKAAAAREVTKTRFEHLLLDDTLDAIRAQEEFDGWSTAISTMPTAARREYVIASLMKLSGFCERHTTALQEHSLATKQDPMTAALSSTQGLAISTEMDAPLRSIENTADRMFPFRGGREMFYDILPHTNMAHALVLCSMIDDAVAEGAAWSAPRAVDGDAAVPTLGPSSPWLLMDFLSIQHGARMEVSYVKQHHISGEHWRAPCVTKSLRVVGDGVALQRGELGVLAVLMDGSAAPTLSSNTARGTFFALDRAHTKILAFSAADAAIISAVGEVPSSNQRSASSRKRARQSVAAANPPSATFDVDLEDLRDRVVQTELLGSARRAACHGILARDVLEPRRRMTRHTSKLIARQQLDNTAPASTATPTPAGGEYADEDDDVIIEGEGRVVSSESTEGKSLRYDVEPRRTHGEALLSTLRVMMCMAIRVGAEQLRKATPGEADIPCLPYPLRVALVELLVLQSLPARFGEVVRLASPEIAWYVVQGMLSSERRCTSPLCVQAAGYALALVDPPTMSLPLWYALLAGLYQRKAMACPTGVKAEQSATPQSTFSVLWGLWQMCVLKHPLLPSALHSSVWDLMARVGVLPKQNSGAVTDAGGKKVSLKIDAAVPRRSTERVPHSPTASEASVVEIELLPQALSSSRPRTRRAAALAQEQHRLINKEVSVIVEESASGRLIPVHIKKGRMPSGAGADPKGAPQQLHDNDVIGTMLAPAPLSYDEPDDVPADLDAVDARPSNSAKSWITRCHALWVQLSECARCVDADGVV